MKIRASAGVMVAGAVMVCAGTALAQTAAVGPRPNQFPDVIVSGVGASTTDLLYYGTTGGISSYAMGSVSCNIATNSSHVAIWIDGAGTFGNQHPVIGGQVYRLANNRFQQIGISWLKHGFCAADASNCLSLANPGTTVPLSPNGSCDWLGTGSTDTYSASLNGSQTSAGPRSEVNPWTGQFPYPYVLGSTGTFNCLGKRLQLKKTDLDPATWPTAQYFGEVVYICTDEWEPQRLNNYSYRLLSRGALRTTATGGAPTCTTEQGYGLSFSGATIAKKAAIEAWKAADPQVKLVYTMTPNDGQIAVASRAISEPDGSWRYEYAVMNLNCHRAVGSFTVPKAVTQPLLSTSFSAPEYHSGEIYSNRAWEAVETDMGVTFATEPYDANTTASAIRWSTLYNFTIVTNRAPTTGSVTLGLFGRAIVPGDPDAVSVPGLDVPSQVCIADFNGVGGVTGQDVFDFLAAWFSQTPSADVNGSGTFTVQDVFAFLQAFFTGCA